MIAAITKEELIEAKDKLVDEREAINRAISGLEEAYLAQSDIKAGATVKIIANRNTHESGKLGFDAIGETTEVASVWLACDGEIIYTTTWRDKHGLLWGWTRDELELVSNPIKP